MSGINPINQLALFYTEQPVLQALFQSIPLLGITASDTLLKARAQEIAQERARIFFEELASQLPELTPVLIQSEEFIHRFVITAKAAANTRRQEKIRLFARLLGASTHDRSNVNTDEYEEYVSILDELSYREILVLDTLEKYERTHPLNDGENELQRCSKFWDTFLSEITTLLQINQKEVNAILTRLNRTGCYSTITGSYSDYDGDRGHLTELYRKLKQILNQANA